MISVIEKMHAKRFCLPSSMERGNTCNICEGYGYNHAACIFKGKGKVG